jgi:hypothetical protein
MNDGSNYLSLMRFAGQLVEWSGCRHFKPTKCTAGQGSKILYVSKGTMNDYAYYHSLSALPFTLETYVGEAPTDMRSWDNNPDTCFYFYNPKQNRLINQLKQWKKLWRGVYYMSPREQLVVKTIVDQFAEDSDGKPRRRIFDPAQLPGLSDPNGIGGRRRSALQREELSA